MPQLWPGDVSARSESYVTYFEFLKLLFSVGNNLLDVGLVHEVKQTLEVFEVFFLFFFVFGRSWRLVKGNMLFEEGVTLSVLQFLENLGISRY